MKTVLKNMSKKEFLAAMGRVRLDKMMVIVLLLVIILFNTALLQPIYAATCTADSSGTTTPLFDEIDFTILFNAVNQIRTALNTAISSLNTSLIQNSGLSSAVHAAITIYIMIYGIMFMSGMLPLKLYDLVIRLVKISVIGIIFSTPANNFFSDTMVSFFDTGTGEIITYVSNNGPLPYVSNNVPIPNTGGVNGVMTIVSTTLSNVISEKMLVTILGLFAHSVYGMVYAGILVMAVWSVIKSIITAAWVYLISSVMRMLLLGLAPIFIPTILFQRTRGIFDGWINQLINASLQPILLFTFFLFFIKMIDGAIDVVTSNPLCFSKMPDGLRGSPVELSFWRFMEPGAGGWEVAGGDSNGPPPVGLVDVLTLFIISEVASRFNGIVLNIANQISGTSTKLTSSLEGAMGSAVGAVRSRLGRAK